MLGHHPERIRVDLQMPCNLAPEPRGVHVRRVHEKLPDVQATRNPGERADLDLVEALVVAPLIDVLGRDENRFDHSGLMPGGTAAKGSAFFPSSHGYNAASVASTASATYQARTSRST